jgi:RNA polymerase sigma factor (sigma-70 family)
MRGANVVLDPGGDPKRWNAEQPIGEALTWSEAYALHRQSLLRYATVLGGHSGADLVHDAFESAMGAKPEGFIIGDKPIAYLRKCVYNKHRDQCRRLGYKVRVLLAVDGDMSRYDAPNTDDSYVAVETRALFRKTISRLSPRARAAVLLRYWLDAPMDEIAATLGISVVTVNKDLRGALKRLKIPIEQDAYLVESIREPKAQYQIHELGGVSE